MSESIQAEVSTDKRECMRVLVGQAEGRQADSLGDTSLMEQLSSPDTETIDGQYILKCRMGGCSLKYLVETESGALWPVDFDGDCGREKI